MIGVETIEVEGEKLTFRFDFNARRLIAGYGGESFRLEGGESEEEVMRKLEASAEKLKHVDTFSVYENFVLLIRGGLHSGMGKDYGEEFIDKLFLDYSEALEPVMAAAREGFDLTQKKMQAFAKMAMAR